MKESIKIYKGLLSEEERLKSLDMMSRYPNEILSQSVCTDEGVYQLREFLPLSIAKQIFNIHIKILPLIQKYFDLSKDNIFLKVPTYLGVSVSGENEILTVDKRIPGMLLPIHRDIPTGDYSGHFGLDGGMTTITITGIYYWNDNYDGGELLFDSDQFIDGIDDESDLKDPFLYKPVAGDFLVFPSHLYHEILEVKMGDRYSTQYFFNRKKQYHISELPPVSPKTIKS